MKKRWKMWLLAACLVLAAAGCGKKSEGDGSSAYGSQIKLGEYKGIEVDKVSTEVTDEDIESAVKNTLTANAPSENLTEGQVQTGDSANIDFVGKKDGVAFEGGTGSTALVIGSGRFIPGFEDGLIGAEIGSTVDLDLTFPEDYGKEELNGQAVVFTVTINSVDRSQPQEELTDELVQSISDFETVDEYMKQLKTDLQTEKEESAATQMKNAVWEKAIENAEFLDVQEYQDKFYDEMIEQYTYYAQLMGTDLETYVTSGGTDYDEFVKTVKENALLRGKSELLYLAIADAEGIQITDEEYQAFLEEQLESTGAPSTDDLVETYTEEYLRNICLWQKTINFVWENAVVKE